MKTTKLCLFAFPALIIAGCSTVDSRISDHRAQFDSWPPPVQQNVREQKVLIGFTVEQVYVALGEPDRKYTRTTAQGTEEVWAYRSHEPVISFGFGLGSASGSSAYGAGVGMTTGGDRYDDKLRVVFSNGKVVALESATAR